MSPVEDLIVTGKIVATFELPKTDWCGEWFI